MANNELELEFQRVTEALNDFIENENECRMVQYREKSDIKAKNLPLYYTSHSGPSRYMYYGYRAWLNAARALIDTNNIMNHLKSIIYNKLLLMLIMF